MADVYEKAYVDADSLIADLKLALEREGLTAGVSAAFCDEVRASGLIAEGRGVVGYELPAPPQNPRGAYMHMLLPVPVMGRGIVFNGKKAAVRLGITAAGSLIGGPVFFLSVLQNLVGYDFALIEYHSGAVCNLATLLDANTPMSADSIARHTTSEDCIRPRADCNHRSEGRCDIRVSDVQENLVRLEEKRAVERLGDSFRANRL